MKIIVSGSRTIQDYFLVKNHLDKLIISEIVSGGAKGPDTFALRWAQDNKVPFAIFLPNWNKYGKSAGMIRNKEMAEYGDFLVAFWDEESKGTKGMIDVMQGMGKPYEVILCK